MASAVMTSAPVRQLVRERQVRRFGFIAGALIVGLVVGASWAVSLVHRYRPAPAATAPR